MMGTRIICPKCGEKLRLHKPAIDSTRIKCRQCGHKFYAGKAENWGNEDQPLAGGFHPLPAANVSVSEHVPDLSESADDAIAVVTDPNEGHEKKRRRSRHRQQEVKLPRWAIPVGIIALIGIALAGIFLGQQPPPSPDPYTADAATPNKKSKTIHEVRFEDTLSKSRNNFRPTELVGIWRTNNPPGGFLDLAADGSVQVHGAFLDKNTIDSTCRWFTLRIYGEVYELEFGPEPKLASNHAAQLMLKPDGTLVMTRYTSAAAMSLQERVFTKAPPAKPSE